MVSGKKLDEITVYEKAVGDGKALAVSLDKKGYAAAVDISKILGRDGEYLDIKYADTVIENLMGNTLALRNRSKKPYSELLDSLANIFIGLKRPASYDYTDKKMNTEQLYFQEKTHSLCHLFEGYPKNISFLDEPLEKNVVQKLVDGAASEAIAVNYRGCMDRILPALTLYNLNNLDLNKLDSADGFIIRVNEQYRKGLLDIINKDEYGRHSKYILSASTPREMLADIIKNVDDGDSPYEISNPEQRIVLLNAVKNDVSKAEMNKFLNGEITLDRLTENVGMSKKASELVKGIYVDVDGTLINCNGHSPEPEGMLNDELADYLTKQMQKGKKIVIFSGGSPEQQTKRLQKHKFPGKLLPVVSKEQFRGKVLEVLIDDSNPAYQGFGAKKYINPKEEQL